jgi:hypothetical protein
LVFWKQHYIFAKQKTSIMKQNMKKFTVLLGEGKNQHTLYGEFAIEPQRKDFAEVKVLTESKLQHEEPSGRFAEHNTLKVEKGNWVMGQQVEFNPFKGTISRVWD